jgi:class 3 adenylate cyclase/tetratricopeptide (TPR) repeat protein
MEGERRVVTMLFCDLKGSTAAARQLDPEEWTEIMNGAFEHMITPIYRYEGIVARLMGDAVLAFFGAPIAHENDPERAVLAALGVLDGIASYRTVIERKWGVEIDVRVGINTGLVVVGSVGSDLRMEYTAMGDAINLAARMEQTAEPGTIQITKETYHQVAPFFEVERLEALAVKGVEQPLVAYRVLGRKATPGRLRGIEGLEAPLVGRKGEWNRLGEAASNLERGIGGLVCLLGEAGIGKSRLVRELQANIEKRPSEFAWHETSSQSYETGLPYALFQRLVRRMVGATEGDSAGRLREKLEAIVGVVSGEEEAAVRPVFASLFGLPGEAGQPPLEGEAFKGRLFTVMERLWTRQASQRPTVLVFDDLHWSDPASVALLQHLLPLTEQVPLLLLWAMRPERQAPGWQVKLAADVGYGHRYTEISLRPLNHADSGELVDSLLTISDLPPPIRERILDKTEGNPFFVEEVVRTLIEGGAVVRDETVQHWRATGTGEAIEIPGNVQALLTARIDRLEAGARRTLQLASVIGRSFYYRVLSRVAGASGALDGQLLTLERAELIRETVRLPELEYLFRHALTQEAAYSTILLKQRRIYHRRVGEALEALFPEQRGELAGNLAGHFYAARDFEKALDYYTDAGDGAFRLHASDEAVEHYSQAIACAGQVGASSERLIHLYTRRGRAFELSSRFDDAWDNFQELERLADETGDRALELASLTAQCILRATQTSLYNPQEARKLAKQALTLAQELGDPAAEAKVLWGLLILESWSGGDPNKALAHGQRSLDIARKLGLKEQMAFTLSNLVAANLALSRHEAANRAVLESRALWLELGNAPMLADSYGLVGIIRWSVGDFEGAIAASHERIRISRSIGNDWNHSAGLAMLAYANYELGHFGHSIEFAEKGWQISEKTGNFSLGAYSRIALILSYMQTGAWLQAQKAAEPLDAVRDKIAIFIRPMAAAALAQVKIEQRDFEGAERVLAEVLEIADFDATAAHWAVFPHVARVRQLLAVDEPESALEKANSVIGRLRQAGIRLQLAESLWLKGKAHIALGNWGQAEEALLEARELSEQTNGRQILWQILATLAGVEDRVRNPDAARQLRSQAREIVNYIATNADPPEQKQSFLNRPEVQRLLAASKEGSEF